MREKFELSFSVSNIVSYGVLTILAFIFIFPALNMVKLSLSAGDGRSINLASYVTLFEQVPFTRFFVNSIIIASATILAGLFFSVRRNRRAEPSSADRL